MVAIDSEPTILREVAERENARMADLPALEDWLPLDVVHRLADDRDESAGPVRFTYLWYPIAVHPSGEVTVQEGDPIEKS